MCCYTPSTNITLIGEERKATGSETLSARIIKKELGVYIGLRHHKSLLTAMHLNVKARIQLSNWTTCTSESP